MNSKKIDLKAASTVYCFYHLKDIPVWAGLLNFANNIL